MNDLRAPDAARTEVCPSPRVSVILPFFHAGKYLREAIESVLTQTYKDLELLLVDDGSVAEDTRIANEYEAREPGRIRYLAHPGRANRGMTASRNLALKHASGELIGLIDADDRWREAKLSEQVHLLDRFPQVDAVCGAVNFWSDHQGGEDRIVPTGHIQNRPIRPPEALLKVYPLGRADPPCPSDLLMRRSIVNALGGFEEAFVGPLALYEDQAFLAKFYVKGTIYFDDRVWLDYRIHNDSCTATVTRQGLVPAVRRYCLEWIEAYIRKTRYRYHPAIRIALARALRPYRHPRITRAGRLAKTMLRRLRTSPEAHIDRSAANQPDLTNCQ